MKYSIFQCEGGMGKNILATAVVSSIKAYDPERKIIVVSAWPQVWFNNPDIYQIYPIGQTANFFKNFIKDQDTKVYRIDPYHHQDYILNKRHLIDVWCDLYNIPNIGVGPKLYFSPLELENIRMKILNGVSKPIFLLHTSGGGAGPNARPYSWYRDIPAQNAKDVVDYFKNDYHIYQIGYEGQRLIDGANKLTLETREILAAPLFSQKRLLIDSFSQHAAVALDKKSVVCWIGNDPDVLGYKEHVNIKPNAKPVYDTYHSSYLEDFDIGGNPVQFPYDRLKIFDSNEIINNLLAL